MLGMEVGKIAEVEEGMAYSFNRMFRKGVVEKVT